MKYYTLAKKISRNYGHGDCGDEFHICPINAYHTNSKEFYPLFKRIEYAEKYKENLEYSHHFTIVEMVVQELTEEVTCPNGCGQNGDMGSCIECVGK